MADNVDFHKNNKNILTECKTVKNSSYRHFN